MSAALNHPPARMTVAEFREWDSGDRSGAHWQLVDGEPVAMAPASENHGAIQTEVARLIANHLFDRGSACRVVTEPGIVPRVREAENWRIPDLGVTCAPARGSHEMLEPILVIEILSPNNYRETHANIFAYATLPSMHEVLVLHSTRIEAELLRRQPDGSWPERPTVLREDEALALDSVGLTLPVRAAYRTTSLVA